MKGPPDSGGDRTGETGTTAQVTGTQRITPYRTTLSSQTGLERACNNRDDGTRTSGRGGPWDRRAARVGTSRPRSSSGPHAALTYDSTWALFSLRLHPPSLGAGPVLWPLLFWALPPLAPSPWCLEPTSRSFPRPLTSCLLQGSLLTPVRPSNCSSPKKMPSQATPTTQTPYPFQLSRPVALGLAPELHVLTTDLSSASTLQYRGQENRGQYPSHPPLPSHLEPPAHHPVLSEEVFTGGTTEPGSGHATARETQGHPHSFSLGTNAQSSGAPTARQGW